MQLRLRTCNLCVLFPRQFSCALFWRIFEWSDCEIRFIMNICNSCEFTEYELAQKALQNNAFALEFFERHKIIPKEVFCPICKTKCTFREDRNQFRCRNVTKDPKNKKRSKVCPFAISRFKGTFLDNTKLEPWQVLVFVNIFVTKEFSHKRVVRNVHISLKSSIDWRSFCSEVCQNYLDHQEPIGGEGVIVEIDETLIVKRKYNRGRVLAQTWIFGGIERVSKKRFLVPLIDQRRDSETLIPLIQKFIKPKSLIISDSWRAYTKLNCLDYTHKVINHSENFVCPHDKEVHTQTIERA